MCVAGVRTAHFQRVCLQLETRPSPVPKVFVSRPAQNASSLAINAFVCSVIPYSEVSSRGYLVASDKRVCLQRVILCSEVSSRGYLIAIDDGFVCSVIVFGVENWFRNPQKEQKVGEKSF